jgi:hypothetical protein
VYLAQDLKHRRQVAIKVLRPELAASLGRERFLREITTTANLRRRSPGGAGLCGARRTIPGYLRRAVVATGPWRHPDRASGDRASGRWQEPRVRRDAGSGAGGRGAPARRRGCVRPAGFARQCRRGIAELGRGVARWREAQGDIGGALWAIRRRAGYDVFYNMSYPAGGRPPRDARGRPAGAIKAYSHYLALRYNPEPSVKPEVDRVRAELAQLVSEPR